MKIRSRVFAITCRRVHQKRDTTKSHRDVIFHIFGGNSPPNQIQPKLAHEQCGRAVNTVYDRGCHAYDDKHAEIQDAWPGNARLLSWFKSTYNKARLKSLKVSNSTTGRLDSAKQNRPNSTSDALSTQSTYEHAYSPTNYEGRLSFGSNYTVYS